MVVCSTLFYIKEDYMEFPASPGDLNAHWLNEVLHENEFLRNHNITSLTQESIGAGEGFSSEIVRLIVQYDADSENLPKTMIGKFLPPQPWAREAVLRARVFETEVNFYRDMASKVPLRTPEFIYGEEDTEKGNYILILKDYSHCRKLDQWEGMDEDLAKRIIVRLADFHSRWWALKTFIHFRGCQELPVPLSTCWHLVSNGL